ncbi:MAG: metal-dependent hydrolase [Planctomycetota bacterium]
MDSITHGLSGIVVSSLGIRQKFGIPGMLVFTAVTLFPDIDFLFNIISRSIYVRFHRGFTHSLIYLPLFALFLSLIFYLLVKDIGFKNLYIICFVGLLVHILLDLLNSYGTPVLLPFSPKQYSFNLDIIIDAFVFIPLIAGVIIMWLLPSYQKSAGLIVLAFIIIGVLFRFSQKERAAGLMSKIEPASKASMIPSGMGTIFNPFVWCSIIPHAPLERTQSGDKDISDKLKHNAKLSNGLRSSENLLLQQTGYSTYNINTLSGKVGEKSVIFYPRDEIAKFIPMSKAIRDFLNWSRFPFGRIENTPEGVNVKLSDLRFQYGPKERFMLSVRFGKDNQLISERFGFSGND